MMSLFSQSLRPVTMGIGEGEAGLLPQCVQGREATTVTSSMQQVMGPPPWLLPLLGVPGLCPQVAYLHPPQAPVPPQGLLLPTSKGQVPTGPFLSLP